MYWIYLILSILPLSGAYTFEGAVALSNCSGAFVKFASSKNSDPGIVITNGHCSEAGIMDFGEWVSNRSSSKSFKLLKSNGAVVGTLRANKLLYATSTDTDIALYSLTQSFEQISNQFGVRPMTLSSSPARSGTSIEVISGLWRRGYSCSISKIIPKLKENPWIFLNSLRYSSGCNLQGGSSGAPVVQSGTRKIIAIHNTHNRGGRDCSFNNPCEQYNDGTVVAQEGFGYGQQTAWIYSCLDENNKVKLSKPGCRLPH